MILISILILILTLNLAGCGSGDDEEDAAVAGDESTDTEGPDTTGGTDGTSAASDGTVTTDTTDGTDPPDGTDATLGCSSECPELGATRCQGDGSYEICQSDEDDDPCLEWGEIVACNETQRCYDFTTNVTTGASYAACETSCATDTHCLGAWWGNLCDKSQGRCVQCKTLEDCKAISPTLGVCTDGGRCLACLTDADCAQNPSSLGPTCKGYETKLCRCDSDSECAGSPFGETCGEYTQQCGCFGNAECKGAASVCQYSGFESRACGKPCASDADCPFAAAPSCGAGGLCVSCTADAQCPEHKPHCKQSTGLCVPCQTSTDCKAFGSVYGACQVTDANHTECVGCTTDADCAKNPAAPGAACVGTTCQCKTKADCTNISAGNICVDLASHKTCACADDAECAEPGAKCLQSSGQNFSTCRVPCTSNQDCAQNQRARVCDPTFSECVECLSVSDCKQLSPTMHLCDKAICLECQADDDCTANDDALGPHCIQWDTKAPTCGCFAPVECANNLHGSVCSEGAACGCDKSTDCGAGEKCKPFPYASIDHFTCQ